MSDSPETVLIVEDEPDLADLFAAWLESDYTVRTAYDGDSALELMDDTVDCVLLDRRMPGRSGGEILEAIREEGYDTRVAMVTAVEPDFDILEMGFDDYVVKPVTRDDLQDLVKELLSLRDYDDLMQSYFQLASKKAALESSKSDLELADHADYQRLVQEIDRVKQRADASLDSENTTDLLKEL